MQSKTKAGEAHSYQQILAAHLPQPKMYPINQRCDDLVHNRQDNQAHATAECVLEASQYCCAPIQGHCSSCTGSLEANMYLQE